eukprot:256137_1
MDYHGIGRYSNFIESTVPKTGKRNNSTCWNVSCFLCELWAHFPTFHPMGPFRCMWDVFVLLVTTYTIFEIPFTLTFGTTETIIFTSVTIDVIMTIDIFLNFHTAYFSKFDSLRLTTDKRSICKKYLRRRFIFDFIATIPVGLLSQTHLWYFKFFRIFRLLKIFRLIRLVNIYEFLRQFIHFRQAIIFLKFFKIISLMILLAHYAACIWWTIGERTHPSWIDDERHNLRDDNLSNFQKYSFAMYWAVITLFTTGYGDIVATNMTEQWYCCALVIIGTCFFSYFISALAVIITEGDRIKSYSIEKLEEAREFCRKKKLPKELRRAVLTHIRYHCNYNYVFDEDELMDLLPPYLKYDVNLNIAEQFLNELEIFNNNNFQLEPFIIGQIALKMKSISCNQGYTLYHIGDASNEFYIQRTGVSSLIDKNNRKKKLHRGDICGEYESFLHKKRQHKVVCNTWSEFYVIQISDMIQILNHYCTPKQTKIKWNNLQKYIQNAASQKVKHTVELGNNRFMDQDMSDNQQYHKQFIHLFSKNIGLNTGVVTPSQSITDVKLPFKSTSEFELIKKKTRPRTESEARDEILSLKDKKNSKRKKKGFGLKLKKKLNKTDYVQIQSYPSSDEDSKSIDFNYSLLTDQSVGTTSTVHRKQKFGGKFKVERTTHKIRKSNYTYHTDFQDTLATGLYGENENNNLFDE